MGGVTLSEIGEAAKLISAIIGACAGIGGIILFAIKPITKKLQDIQNELAAHSTSLTNIQNDVVINKTDLTYIKNDISEQKNDIMEIKEQVNILTTQYNELERKASANRQLDNLLVKTMRLIIDTNEPEQQAIKTELDNFLINQAVN